MALVGILVALLLYRLQDVVSRARVLVAARLQGVHAFLRNKWFLDDIYGFLFTGVGGAGAAFTAYVFDARVVDGAVNGVGAGVRSGAGLLRRLQSGYVRAYALGILVGATAVMAWVLIQNGVNG